MIPWPVGPVCVDAWKLPGAMAPRVCQSVWAKKCHRSVNCFTVLALFGAPLGDMQKSASRRTPAALLNTTPNFWPDQDSIRREIAKHGTALVATHQQVAKGAATEPSPCYQRHARRPSACQRRFSNSAISASARCQSACRIRSSAGVRENAARPPSSKMVSCLRR